MSLHRMSPKGRSTGRTTSTGSERTDEAPHAYTGKGQRPHAHGRVDPIGIGDEARPSTSRSNAIGFRFWLATDWRWGRTEDRGPVPGRDCPQEFEVEGDLLAGRGPHGCRPLTHRIEHP